MVTKIIGYDDCHKANNALDLCNFLPKELTVQ